MPCLSSRRYTPSSGGEWQVPMMSTMTCESLRDGWLKHKSMWQRKNSTMPYAFDEIPNAQYPSLIVSLCEIVKTHEKKLKSLGIVKAEELRKMKAEYENFVLAYHRGGIDDFRKYSNYTLTRPFWSFVYNYHLDEIWKLKQ